MSDVNWFDPEIKKNFNERQLVALEARQRQAGISNLLDFTRYTFPKYFADPAHTLIAKKLDDVIDGKIRRLMISAPPRHGKTELASVRFPAYWLGRRPDDEIILCAYGASLAEEKSGFSRDVVESSEYMTLFGRTTRSDSRSVSRWRMEGGRGSLVATGISGSITGKGATLAIVDDPFKDWEEAQSEKIRETCWNWYRTTFLSRLEEDGAIIVIQTRWHDDDLAGRLLKEQPGKWDVLRLPALAETQQERDLNNDFLGLPLGESDPLGRLPGEALCPHRYTAKKLVEIKEESGPMSWSALYQGVPRPAEGNMFKRSWFPVVEKVPYEAKRIRAWDKAASEEKSSDFTAGPLVSVHDGIFYVEDLVHGQWNSGERDKRMKKTADQDATRYKNTVRIWVEQEPGSGGKESAQNSVRLLAGYPVDKQTVSGDKVTRADGFASQARNGNVRILRGSWNKVFLDEFTTFPNGKHDDIVDATCFAFNKLAGNLGSHATLKVFGLKGAGISTNKGISISGATTKNNGQPKIAVCSKEELGQLDFDQECLLISICDPESIYTIPPHKCQRLLGRIELSFADLDPNANECQEWDQPVQPWNKKPEELIMSKEQGKKLWSFILKKRDATPVLYLVQGDGETDRRAMSVAMAMSDAMYWKREKSVYLAKDPDSMCVGDAPNKHVYQICRSTRHSIIG